MMGDKEQAMTMIEPAVVGAQLELPGLEVSELGAWVVGPVDVDAVTAALGRLSRGETWTRWMAGDLFLALAAAYDLEHPGEVEGAGVAAAFVAVSPLGFAPAWLNQAIEVSRRVPVDRRRAGLSWGHHRAVAVDDVPAGDQGMWLGRAVANGWSVRQLEAAILEWLSADQGQLELPDPPPRIPPAAVARIVEAAALTDDGWVLVHVGDWAVRAPGAGR